MDEEDITLWERFTDELSKLDAEKAEAKRKKQKNTQNAPQKNDELKGAKLVSGDYVYVQRRKLIGFCRCDLHKGYVTKSIYRNHKCGEKQCVFFQKFEDCPFWAAEKGYKRYKNLSPSQKSKIKSEEEKFVRMAEELQKLADKFGYPMKITSVRQGEHKKHIIVFYLSDRPYNDFYRFLDLSRTFGFYRSAYVELRHVKDINGNYALM